MAVIMLVTEEGRGRDRGIPIVQGRAVGSSPATCCTHHSVMLLTETFEMRKCILTISLVKCS